MTRRTRPCTHRSSETRRENRMTSNRTPIAIAGCLILILGTAAACEPPGVGDPCAPETTPVCRVDSAGNKVCEPWAYGEVSVETRSVQCKTRTCLVYHFFPAGREPGEPDWRFCTSCFRGAEPTYGVSCRVPDPHNPGKLVMCGTDSGVACPPNCCEWPDPSDSEQEGMLPCRTRSTEEFVRKFCKKNRDGAPIINPYCTPDPADDANPWVLGDPRHGWYCDFDMSLVNLSQPFCTLKCKGAGRTFECPSGFTCRGEVRLGQEGMRGTYCVPERLVDCDTSRGAEGLQDCCGTRID